MQPPGEQGCTPPLTWADTMLSQAEHHGSCFLSTPLYLLCEVPGRFRFGVKTPHVRPVEGAVLVLKRTCSSLWSQSHAFLPLPSSYYLWCSNASGSCWQNY